ncbi:unnamed protein product [Prorocentrum cordatum]|uniref:Uncharacterized protein n=1 Tax=Prorocentrum cordatum TaxID=2364126 RepID=A0ABN9SL34_9DINO|nr:unnamed protein product [Polarella glacialis]
MSDAAVLLDRCEWLTPSLPALKMQSREDGALWDFLFAALQRQFSALVKILGLDPPSPHPRSLRRGGASDDLATASRTQEEVRARGRWATLTSLKRCGETTWLLLEMAKAPEDALAFGREVQASFSNVLSEGFAGPLLVARLPPRLAEAPGPAGAVPRGLPGSI